MQAMIFAAGMGTRLKPITDVIPKALVPVGDKPLMQYVFERLYSAGFENVVVNVHHKSGQIKNFLNLLENYLPVTISVSDESEKLLETGGGVKKASSLFTKDEYILIHNVDIISNVDLGKLYNNVGNADALLLVSSRKTQRYLLFDDEMRLVGWTNVVTGEVKSPYENLDPDKFRKFAFAGIHVIGRNLVEDMGSWPERFSIVDFYLGRCCHRIIKGYCKEDLKILDVGKLDTLENADNFIQEINN